LSQIFSIGVNTIQEKEKELFKKSKIDIENNKFFKADNNSEKKTNVIQRNEIINLGNYKSINDIPNKDEKKVDKVFVSSEKNENKYNNNKTKSNLIDLVDTHKKRKSKINLQNNSSSVFEINYNQNQIDEEENKESKRSPCKNTCNSNQFSNNKENFKILDDINLLNSESNRILNYKISSNNIDLYNKISKDNTQKENLLRKDSIKSNENSNNVSESLLNGKLYHKIKYIYPFKNSHNKSDSKGKRILNNSQGENKNLNYNLFDNSKTFQSPSNSIKNNSKELKRETNISLTETIYEKKSFHLQNENLIYDNTFKNENHENKKDDIKVNLSRETIAKEGEIQTNNIISNKSKINTNGETNKNVLIIRGSKIEKSNNSKNLENSNLNNYDIMKNVINQKKEDHQIIKIDKIKEEEQQEFLINKHRYNSSKDTGFLSITATEEYLELINSKNKNFKTSNLSNINKIIDPENKLDINKDNNQISIMNEKEMIKLNISSRNINDNININDITSKLISNENNSSRSIFRHDFASLYLPYTSHILSLGGKSDIVSRKFSIENNSWTSIKEIKVDRSDFIGLMYKEKRILILGGKSINYNGIESVTDTIDLLSTDDQNIVRLDFKLKIPRSNFGALYLDYKLFVAGGYNGRDALNNFEYFDKKTKKWIDLPKMLNKKKEFSMILGPDKNIYCLGGSDEREYDLYFIKI